MTLIITVQELQADCNWIHAFHEAFAGQYGDDPRYVESVAKVIAADEGERDGRSWLGVFEMKDREKGFAVVRAGCDYTGWD